MPHKDGTVIPASKLTEAKKQELQRAGAFEAAFVDEKRITASKKSTSTLCSWINYPIQLDFVQ